MAKALTAKAVENLAPTASRMEVADGGMQGLYLVVQPSGAKSWAVRYRFAGKPRKMTIGPYPLFGLLQAREAAGKALRAVSEGRDPAEEVKAKKAGIPAIETVDAALNDFIARHVEPNNKESWSSEVKRIIEADVRPRWGKRRLADIHKRDVLSLLDAVTDRGARVAANRLFALLRKFFNWSIERGLIEASPTGGMRPPAAETSRDRVLSADEIRLFWEATGTMGWPFGHMARLLLLTGQRREEVAAASWDELELHGPDPTWVIPKERSKNGQAHSVPLSPQAVTILQSLPRLAVEKTKGKARKDLILTTTGETPVSGYSRAKAALDARMLALAQQKAKDAGADPHAVHIAPWRFHDLRRTAASIMASLGQPIHVVEAVLNHRSGTIKGVSAVYVRHNFADEKRRALNALANYVDELIGLDRNNVIGMRKVSG
jgi:integrase